MILQGLRGFVISQRCLHKIRIVARLDTPRRDRLTRISCLTGVQLRTDGGVLSPREARPIGPGLWHVREVPALVQGLHVPPWSGRRRQEALATVKAKGRRAKSPCCICDQGIDYSLEYPHPQSCSVQHIKSRKRYPGLTWDPSNWAPAHLDCNKGAGLEPLQGLGLTSNDW
ncbi:HNH endonuclease [Sinomonas sp. ASV322]|uniref:HNH endonuclease n=1 Tax=Sinomonas sp. ASV322 TaxID=3041920 RepID=UPI0035A309FF